MTMAAEIEPRVITLHEGQTRAMQSDARFVAMICGTGGGKTWFGPYWCMNEIAKHPGGSGMIVSPTYDMLRRESRALFMASVKGTDFEGTFRAVDNEYTTPDGTKIYFRSADKPNSLEGGQRDWIWLDEAGQYKVGAWIAIQARVGFKMGRVLFTTTPYAQNWLKKEVEDRWKKGDTDYDVIRFASIENPGYPKDEFERARRTLPKAIFERRYLGLFTKLAGLVYPDMDETLIDAFEIPDHWQRIGAVDFGFHSPFVMLTGALDPDGVLYIWKEYYTHPHLEGDKLTKDHIEHVEPRTRYHCDPADPQVRVDMQAMIDEKRSQEGGRRFKDVQLVQAKNPIQAGIVLVTQRIKLGTLKVFKGACPNMMDEAELYRYPGDEMEPEKGEKPVDADNHAMDCLRYMVYALDADSGMAKPDIWEL